MYTISDDSKIMLSHSYTTKTYTAKPNDYGTQQYKQETTTLADYIQRVTTEGRSGVPCFGVEGIAFPRTQATQANLLQTQILVIDIDKTAISESYIYDSLRCAGIEPSLISHSWSHNKHTDKSGTTLGCFHLHYIFAEPIVGVQEAKTKLMYIYNTIESVLGGGVADNKVTNPAGVINGCTDGADYHKDNGISQRPIYQITDFVGVSTTTTYTSDKTANTTKTTAKSQHYDKGLIRDSIRVLDGGIDATKYRALHNELRWIYRQEPDKRISLRDTTPTTQQVTYVERVHYGLELPDYVYPQYTLYPADIQPRVWSIDDTYWRLPYHVKKLTDGSKRYSKLLQRAVIRIVGARRYEGMRDVTPNETLFNLVCDVVDFIDLRDGKYNNIQRLVSIANDAHNMPTSDQDSMHDTYLRSKLNVTPKGGKVAQRGVRVDSEYKDVIIDIIAHHHSIYLTRAQNCDVLNEILPYYGIDDVVLTERTYKQYLATIYDEIRKEIQDSEGDAATTAPAITDEELWAMIVELGWQTYGDKRLHKELVHHTGKQIGRRQVERVKRQHATA